MSPTFLTREKASALISEIFVYHMPFNRSLGLELQRFEADYAELVFDSKEMLVGNAHQKILHGGVIASVLDVCAGLVCVGSALLRHDEIGVRLENGIYGHSRFCNTDFDDKLACLNLSGV